MLIYCLFMMFLYLCLDVLSTQIYWAFYCLLNSLSHLVDLGSQITHEILVEDGLK